MEKPEIITSSPYTKNCSRITKIKLKLIKFKQIKPKLRPKQPVKTKKPYTKVMLANTD